MEFTLDSLFNALMVGINFNMLLVEQVVSQVQVIRLDISAKQPIK
jgi:hypothetical protein